MKSASEIAQEQYTIHQGYKATYNKIISNIEKHIEISSESYIDYTENLEEPVIKLLENEGFRVSKVEDFYRISW